MLDKNILFVNNSVSENKPVKIKTRTSLAKKQEKHQDVCPWRKLQGIYTGAT